MITIERLDKIEQDLEWARENADRSAQTRLFIHHVPFLLTILRPVAEAIEAERLEEEEYLAELEEESTEGAGDSESETETDGSGIASRIQEKVQDFLGSSDDVDATDVQTTDEEGVGPVDPQDEISTDQDSPEAVEEITE